MSAAAGAAAAARARQLREEEESMTGYNSADLDDHWEFKIVRSATRVFKNPARLRQALEEESRAGWVLVEKFDNQRIRLKRPASARAGDAGLGVDPYNTTYGMGEGKLAAIIVACTFTFIGLLLATIFFMTQAAQHQPVPAHP